MWVKLCKQGNAIILFCSVIKMENYGKVKITFVTVSPLESDGKIMEY